jgi:hypothetical protein
MMRTTIDLTATNPIGEATTPHGLERQWQVTFEIRGRTHTTAKFNATAEAHALAEYAAKKELTLFLEEALRESQTLSAT